MYADTVFALRWATAYDYSSSTTAHTETRLLSLEAKRASAVECTDHQPTVELEVGLVLQCSMIEKKYFIA